MISDVWVRLVSVDSRGIKVPSRVGTDGRVPRIVSQDWTREVVQGSRPSDAAIGTGHDQSMADVCGVVSIASGQQGAVRCHGQGSVVSALASDVLEVIHGGPALGEGVVGEKGVERESVKRGAYERGA